MEPRARMKRPASRGGRARAAWRALLCTTAICLLACNVFRAPKPRVPPLSAGLKADRLRVDGYDRSYVLYIPARRPAHAPLLMLLHGSRQTAESLRRVTGYQFERLAEEHGFVVAYPNAYRRRWNDCRATGRYAARRRHVDDVGFLLALVGELAERAGIDRRRVFLAGYSAGGQLAFRVALEHPERVAGIAAFSANLPTADNFACEVAGKPVPVLLVEGTRDRINPFVGGKVTVFGFRSRGYVRSARESAEFFARLAGENKPSWQKLGASPDTWVEQWRWSKDGAPEVVLLTIHGGGHVVPGESSAFPRILGPVSAVIDGPRQAWDFFARQAPSNAPLE